MWKVKWKAVLLGGIGRMLAGEKFFFQTLKLVVGLVKYLAPSIPGDIVDVELDGSYSLVVQKDGFLAGSWELKYRVKCKI